MNQIAFHNSHPDFFFFFFEVLTPSISEYDHTFGDRAFLEVMKPLEYILILSAWCSYKKSWLGRRKRHQGAQRNNHVTRKQEGGHPQATERGLRRNPPSWNLNLDLPATRTVRRWVSVVLSLWYFVMVTLTN